MEETTLSESKLNVYLIVDDIEIGDEAFKIVKERDGKSLSKIGDAYYENKNYTKAIDWFRLSAAKDDVYSQYKLGYMYEHNKGVPTDYNMAMQCYLNAHNNGDAKATNSIGRLYYYGKGVDENEHTALKWFLEAANNGDSTARCNAGFYYEYGRGGVQMDKKYALELYERSAEQGYKGAKTSIRSLNKEGYCIDVLQRRCIQVEKDVVEQKSNMNLLEKKVKLAEQRRFKADNEIRILKERVGVLMKISNVDMIDPMVLPYEINEAIPGTSLTGIEIISLPDDKIDEENPENDAGSH